MVKKEWRTRKRGTKKQRGLKFPVKSKEKTVGELLKKNPKWLTIVKAKGKWVKLDGDKVIALQVVAVMEDQWRRTLGSDIRTAKGNLAKDIVWLIKRGLVECDDYRYLPKQKVYAFIRPRLTPSGAKALKTAGGKAVF